MNNLLRKLFDIREGEAPRTLLMFLYIFLVISSIVMLKSVRDSLFLDKFAANQLPYVFILVAVTAVFISTMYSRFSQKVALNKLIKYSLLFIIFNLLALWYLFYIDYRSGWFFYALYAWVAIFAVITTSQFWISANFIYNARQAKRLFGFMGTGAISGGIFGGYFTKTAILFGTENLLLFCAAFIAVCVGIVQIVWKMREKDLQSTKTRRRQTVKQTIVSDNPLKLFRNSRHLLYLAGIVGISIIVATLVDFQYKSLVQEIIPDKDERTAFFGMWLSNLSIISLLIQLLLTRRILSRFGVSFSLFFLPIGILLGATTIFLLPVLGAAIFIKVSDGSLKQSINKAGLELLIMPIPPSIKPQAKAFIDVFIDSFATGIGGALIILFSAGLGFSTGDISLVIIALILFWVMLITRIRKEYVQAFRMAIEKRTIDLEMESVNLQDGSLFESFLKILESNNPRQILYVLNLLENVNQERFITHLINLINHPSAEIRSQALKMIAQYKNVDLSAEVSKMIHDEDQDVRVAAIRYLLSKTSKSKKIDFLNTLLSSQDYRIQTAALMCAAVERAEDKNLRKTFDLQNRIEMALKNLNRLEDHEIQKSFVKIQIAKSIGAANLPSLYPYLHILLDDKAVEVVQQAVISSGRTKAEEFIPVLIPLLKHKRIRKFAREALAEFGGDIVGQMVAYLNDPNEDRYVRLGIPAVLGLIESQKAVDALLKNLDQDDLLIKFQVLKSLNRLRTNFPLLKFNKQFIDKIVLEEIKGYHQILTLLYTQCECLSNGVLSSSHQDDRERIGKAQKLLIKALEEKLDSHLDRIFRLLGLKYLAKDMYNAYLGIISKKQDLRANAVEFLDNVLDSGLKKSIIPIIETSSFETQVEVGRRQFEVEVPGEAECLEILMNTRDNWLKACAIFLIAETKNDRFFARIGPLINSREPLIKETARYALRCFGEKKNA